MPKVTNKTTGEEVEVEAGSELKDVIRDKGWPVAFGCEDGMCGTCILKIDTGMGSLTPKDEQESGTLDVMGMNDDDHRLACKCKVNGDVTIEGM